MFIIASLIVASGAVLTSCGVGDDGAMIFNFDGCSDAVVLLPVPDGESINTSVSVDTSSQVMRCANGSPIKFNIGAILYDEESAATRSRSSVSMPGAVQCGQCSLKPFLLDIAAVAWAHSNPAKALSRRMYYAIAVSTEEAQVLAQGSPCTWAIDVGRFTRSMPVQQWSFPLASYLDSSYAQGHASEVTADAPTHAEAQAWRSLQDSPACPRGFTAGKWTPTQDERLLPGFWVPGPPPCVFRVNTAADLADRFAGRRILVAGDSISRHFYFALLEMAGACYEGGVVLGDEERGFCNTISQLRNDRSHRLVAVRGVEYEFVWATHVHWFKDLEDVRDGSGPILEHIAAADIVILGSGFWHLDHPVCRELWEGISSSRTIVAGSERIATPPAPYSRVAGMEALLRHALGRRCRPDAGPRSRARRDTGAGRAERPPAHSLARQPYA